MVLLRERAVRGTALGEFVQLTTRGCGGVGRWG